MTWQIWTVFSRRVFSCDRELMSTKLNLDFFWFESTQIQSNHELAIVCFCFLFNSFDAFEDAKAGIFRYTWRHCCGIYVFLELNEFFLNSLFSNPSSASDRCWPCKVIFSLSTSSEISSGLYWFSGSSEAIVTGPECFLCWQHMSRPCSSKERAMSLHKSHKNP